MWMVGASNECIKIKCYESKNFIIVLSILKIKNKAEIYVEKTSIFKINQRGITNDQIYGPFLNMA